MSALHAPDVERISKAKGRKPCGVGAKLGLAAIHGSRPRVGEPGVPGNTYDRHTLAAQLEQVCKLCLHIGVEPDIPVVNLRCADVHTGNPGAQIIRGGRFKSLTPPPRHWFKRRQAAEPIAGHRACQGRASDGPVRPAGWARPAPGISIRSDSNRFCRANRSYLVDPIGCSIFLLFPGDHLDRSFPSSNGIVLCHAVVRLRGRSQLR
ncbi:MAG TPA: hypothetical protein PKB14_11975 [Rubrivivax sp.]|nr:hypothetical protein [Rubrivivax sp.]